MLDSEVIDLKRTEHSFLVPLLTALSLPGGFYGPPASGIILAGLAQTLSPQKTFLMAPGPT